MYIKIGGRWRYVKPVVDRATSSNRGMPSSVVLRRTIPNAAFYVRYREGSRVIWRKCSSAADATVARERQEAYLTAFAHGLTPKQQWDKTPPPATMNDVLLPWLEEYRLSHQPESHALMVQTLNEFNNWCRKDIVAKITTVDLLRYRAWLIEKKRSPRTAANKMLRVNQFIRSVRGLREGEGLLSTS